MIRRYSGTLIARCYASNQATSRPEQTKNLIIHFFNCRTSSLQIFANQRGYVNPTLATN